MRLVQCGLRKEQIQLCPGQVGHLVQGLFMTCDTGLEETACDDQSDEIKSGEGYSKEEQHVHRDMI